MEIIPGTQKFFGRLPSADERDKTFLISNLILETEVPPITKKYWNANGWWGDQEANPHCVGYSWAHWVEDGPVTQKGQAPIINPEELYHAAQFLDEWPGEAYEGTSVRAGAKFLQDKGIIQSYYWAWDVDTLANALLTKGPVVVGTNWYGNMVYPDKKGIIKIDGPVVGGHAYLLNGVNTKTKFFRIKNSWGRLWGKKGHAYISFEDMSKLISEDGEICLALENKL